MWIPVPFWNDGKGRHDHMLFHDPAWNIMRMRAQKRLKLGRGLKVEHRLHLVVGKGRHPHSYVCSKGIGKGGCTEEDRAPIYFLILHSAYHIAKTLA